MSVNQLEHFPDTADFANSRRLRRNLVLWLLSITVILVIGTMTAVAYFMPSIEPSRIVSLGAVIVVCIAIPILVCYEPRIGVYILFVGALVCPSTAQKGIATMPTSYVPFWWNVSTTGQMNGTSALAPLVFSLAELLMVLTFVTWLVRGVVLRQFHFTRGAFFWAILVYILMVAVGLVNGVMHSSNTTMALYEVRGQAAFFMIYILSANLIKDRRQLMHLLWLIVICNGVQGILGTVTYFIQHDNITEDGFMAHDESLILNLIFFIVILSGTLGTSRRLTWAAALLAPTALIAVLGNQRRASIAAFIIAFLPLLPILWVCLKERRKQIGSLALIMAAIASIYFPIAWNSNGAWALPARAIRSQTDPNSRDAASNAYRDAETYDLQVTRDASPFIGYGYGLPFLQPLKLPDVSTDFVYFMPHNSILWVWMRIGHIGFYLFWMMIATFIIKGLEIVKKTQLPQSRTMGILAIVMLLMLLTFGKYDLALVNPRILAITSILLGALSVLPALEPRAARTDDLEDNLWDDSSDTVPHTRQGVAIPF